MSDNLPPLAGISPAEAQQMRADLIRAMGTGSLSVRYSDGSSVTYRDMDDMERALAVIEARISADAAATLGATAPTPVRAIRLIPNSGWR